MWRDRVRRRRLSRLRVGSLTSRKILTIVKIAFIGVIGLFFAAFLLLPVFAFNLPSPDEVVRREDSQLRFWIETEKFSTTFS
ncbi:hypothetical protein A3E15_00420 [Candidatus Woesebacteria bacterium RIFCSPHIGHO2_12_FULL_42_9]|uniref:Uncharacterized protein n=1 Tax=Candidatus Woesebacteria bacterium RIFCSPHIGHO2_12_FULL_42_9 TaxID=1802511 RepID=A0A1F8AXM7_9BACT|nr:MAG: hypothetical protein A3E15_00420 [Candidatus Woesebacteria bacterium RIFCSPHIGHO2_12_FULL_42_9]